MAYRNVVEEKQDGCHWNMCVASYDGPEPTRINRRMTMSFDSPPSPVPPIEYISPAKRPQTAHSMSTRHKSWFKHESSTSKSFRKSSVSTIKRPFTSKSTRPSIGAPTDFRRVTGLTEPMPTRRRSFRPLELSIYIEPSGRLSPLPDFNTDDWELKLPSLARPTPAMLRRETVDNSLLPSDFAVPRKPLSTYSGFNTRRAVVSEPFGLTLEDGPGPVIEDSVQQTEVLATEDKAADEDRTPTLSTAQMDTMVPSIARPWTQNLGRPGSSYRVTQLRSESPLPIQGARSESPSARHARSESGLRSLKGSLRRSKTDTVEEAIKELNTIVEQKRIIKAQLNVGSPPLSPTSHVPAIAPAMAVRARSQTLSDIGSAFSASASTRTLTRSPLPALRIPIPEDTVSAESSATALPQLVSPKPLQSNPVRPAVGRKERLSTWFRRSIPTSPVSVASSEALPISGFYQLGDKELGVKRADSRASTSSTISVSTISTVDTAYATPATTVANSMSPTSPTDENPRPSFSKNPKKFRRSAKRGLSIDTMLSNGSTLNAVPPAYHELDPLPSQLTPTRIGVAC